MNSSFKNRLKSKTRIVFSKEIPLILTLGLGLLHATGKPSHALLLPLSAEITTKSEIEATHPMALLMKSLPLKDSPFSGDPAAQKLIQLLEFEVEGQKILTPRIRLSEPHSATHSSSESGSAEAFSGAFGGALEFYFSSLLKSSEGYDLAVLYASSKKRIYAHLIYRSKSDGKWRTSPWIKDEGAYGKTFSKGIHHYVQETALDPRLNDFLIHEGSKLGVIRLNSELTHAIKSLFQYPPSSGSALGDSVAQEQLEYREALQVADTPLLSLFHGCMPGPCLSLSTVVDDPAGSAHDPRIFFKTSSDDYTQALNQAIEAKRATDAEFKAFFPAFTEANLIKTYSTSHSMLSDRDATSGEFKLDVRVEVYGAKLHDRPIEWHLATDRENRVWIDRIRFQDAQINAFGTNELINGGVLTHKPLDYPHQTTRLDPIQDLGDQIGKYSDISPFLKRLLPIAEYCAARGIP